MGVKNPVKTVKSGREKRVFPVKKIKNMAKNGFHAQNDFHAQKKNTANTPFIFLLQIPLKNSFRLRKFPINCKTYFFL